MERFIGMVYQFGKNDYQINLMEFSEADQKLLTEIFMRYENDCTSVRGDMETSLENANVEYFDE